MAKQTKQPKQGKKSEKAAKKSELNSGAQPVDEKTLMEQKQQEMQQKYMELQMIDAQMKQVQAQLSSLDSQNEEIKEVLNYLTELGILEPGREAYVPMTSGVFVKAEIKNTKKILMNVGSNTVVEKTIEDGKGLISRQLKEVEKIRAQLLAEFNKLGLRSNKLEKELMNLIS